MGSLLTMDDLQVSEILELLKNAQDFSKGDAWFQKEPFYVTNLFFEPSTRTKLSFELAERKLGLNVIPFEASTSSLQKGETLYDTVKTLESIGISAVIIRHEENRYFDQLSNIQIPIINGGDGSGHHPTQCLLDLLTIQQEFGDFTHLKVAIIGDIRHSRVARSNANALTRLGAEVIFSGPLEWFSEDGKYPYVPVDEAILEADVVMMLRIQHERHEHTSHLSKHEYHIKFGLTVERAFKMRPNSIIMHPAPVNRNVEIASELVESVQSRIFKQMENGVYVRMAVLKRALEKANKKEVTV